MLKKFITLDCALEQNGFRKTHVCIIGEHIMAQHYNGQTYICHLKHDGEWSIDKCKHYEKDEAMKVMKGLCENEFN